MVKKCETFGCENIGEQSFQIAPATNVWLCKKCLEEFKKELENEHRE